ncbi:NLR family CARD domain-containing protein 3-like [Anabas testudineus]|uniref:NLR family CARD domain-containing protein 3-like n=1 Tax=Anabas testudineus TaxID=64144 RepID=UPI000E4614BD|nr:NLR family CARD domain-containing protein 3-like [Anabas testudineus]
MEDFLNLYFKDFKQPGVSIYKRSKVVFILDGLEKCEFPLDFEKNKELTDMTEAASIDVLLTNLIKGKLLPSARLWIISQPSGVDKIPSEYIDKVIECRDDKKELTEALKNKILSTYEKKLTQDEMYTKLYETKMGDKQLVPTTYNNIFDSKMRTVLTEGKAKSGKTFYTQMFMVDWAKGNSNQDIDLIVSLSSNELQSKTKYSMNTFLDQHFKDINKTGASIYDKCKLVFILDDLGKFGLPFKLKKNKELTDMKKVASMDELLTNLIEGKLLPSARLWIISQPFRSQQDSS